MQSKNTGILFALIAVFLWATLGITIKKFAFRLESFTITLYVSFFATLSLLLNLAAKKKISSLWQKFKKNWAFFVSTGILGLGIQQILYLKAYHLLPASHVITIFYIYPLLMVLISHIIFKEKISFKSYLFLFIGVLGVYTLISQPASGNINPKNLGYILTLLAALSWALFSTLIKHKKFDIDSGMFFLNLSGLIFLLFITPLFKFTPHIRLSEFIALLYAGIFPTAIAFIFWNKALHLAKTYICSNISMLTPLIALILIAPILKEEIHFSQVIGLTLILSSLALNLKYGDAG